MWYYITVTKMKCCPSWPLCKKTRNAIVKGQRASVNT